MIAASSGNVAVVEELITAGNVDVDSRVLVDIPEFGIQKGGTALSGAVAFASSAQVHAIVALLIGAGADPNAKTVQGFTPCFAAIGFRNSEGVRYLLLSRSYY